MSRQFILVDGKDILCRTRKDWETTQLCCIIAFTTFHREAERVALLLWCSVL